MLFLGVGMKAINSLPEHEKQLLIEETAHDIADSLRPILKDARETMTIKVPNQNSSPRVAKIEFTKPRKSSISRADKLCNDAIFAAMGDRSDEAKQAKKDACAHNVK